MYARHGRTGRRASDDAVLTQASDRNGVETEPVGKHFVGVLAEQWRRLDGDLAAPIGAMQP